MALLNAVKNPAGAAAVLASKVRLNDNAWADGWVGPNRAPMTENKKTDAHRKEPTCPTTLVAATGKAPPGHGCRRLGDAVIGLAGNVIRHFPFLLTLVLIVTSFSRQCAALVNHRCLAQHPVVRS